MDTEELKDFIEDVNSLNEVIKANKYINKLEDLRRVIIRLNDGLQPGVRAGAINIVPNSTGAAKAIGLVIPELAGKLIGSAQRVPVPSGSITILDATLKDMTDTVSVEGINEAMKAASSESFGYTEEELVSSDIVGMSYGSLFDATQTLAQQCGTHIFEVRIVAWYDNEMSYTCQLVRTLKYFAELK